MNLGGSLVEGLKVRKKRIGDNYENFWGIVGDVGSRKMFRKEWKK